MRNPRTLANEFGTNLSISSAQDQIEALRSTWEQDMDNNTKRFSYACALCRSPQELDRREAVIHFEYLLNNSEGFIKDALFQLATTYYLLKEFDLSRRCAEELCRMDPDNQQIRNLQQVTKYEHEKAEAKRLKAEQDTAVAIGVGVLGVAAAVGIGLSFLLRRNR